MWLGITIQGTTALLMNKFYDEAALRATNGNRSASRASKGLPRAQAELKVYTDEDGNIGIPQPNLMRCIVDGGRWHKYNGRQKVTTRDSSIIPACVDIDGAFIPLKFKKPWEVDERPVVIPATKGRILAYRPKFQNWSLNFELELDTDMLDVDLLREVIDSAGKREGLGDFRPANKGPFGKFVVTRWEELVEA